MDFSTLKKEVEARMNNPKKFTHVLGVTDECERLAGIFKMNEYDKRSLMAAGLMHDITKTLSETEQLNLANELGATVDKETKRCPKTFHQLTGAYLAKKLYPDYTDERVFGAIRWHTTGREDMTLFEKLVYLADYVEINRQYSECKLLREHLYSALEEKGADKYEALDRIMLEALNITLSLMIQDGEYIHPATVSARNSLLK